MGCADSRKMLTNETKKDDKYIQNNLLTNNEKDSKNKNNDNNLQKDKLISEEKIGREEHKINNEEKNKINDDDSDEFIIRYGTNNIITLIYYAKTKGVYKIFGENFVAYNKDNIHYI